LFKIASEQVADNTLESRNACSDLCKQKDPHPLGGEGQAV